MNTQSMIFFFNNSHSDNFDEDEEEEEKEEEGGIDDALLGELDEDLEDDVLLAEELDPLLKANIIDPLASEDEDETIKDDEVKGFDDEEDEDVDDYDSFDDHDEM